MIALLLAAAVTPKVAVEVSGHAASAWATSQLTAKDARRYAVRNAFDADVKTAWVEGAAGPGEGESLFLELQQPATIEGFVLAPGYLRSPQTLLENAAPRRVEISADGAKLLALEIAWAVQRPADAPCRRTDAQANLAPRLIVLSKPLQAKALQLRIVEAFAGTKFDDLAISEWQPLFAGAPAPLGLEAARKALIGVRDGTPPLAPDAQADALVPWGRGEPHAAFPEYDALVRSRLGGAELAPPQAFLKVFAPSLLDAAVAADGNRLIGSMAHSEGDGEWSELYPALTLDAQGRIAQLRRAFHDDAAPGCRRGLPR